MAKKKDNNQFVNYISPFDEGTDLTRPQTGKQKNSRTGKHSHTNLTKLEGPPEASQSIATGTLKTKSRLAAEAEDAQAQGNLDAEVAAQGGYAYDGYDGYDGYNGYDASADFGYDGWGTPGGYSPVQDQGYMPDAYENQGYAAGFDMQPNQGYAGGGWDDYWDQDAINSGNAYQNVSHESSIDGYWEQGYGSSADFGGNQGYVGGPDTSWDQGYAPGTDAYWNQSSNGVNDGYWDPNYAGGVDSYGNQSYGAQYAPGSQYDGYNAGYPYDASYNPAGAQGGYYAEDGTWIDASPDNWNANWAYSPEGEIWGAAPFEEEQQKRRKRKKNEQPAVTPMSWEQKYDAEAQARANANAAVEAYERGVPLRTDGYGSSSSATNNADASAGSDADANAKRGVGVPSLRGLGVQVQVPSPTMEKSLNMSANSSHQKQVDQGTGNANKTKKKDGLSGAKPNTYGADKELHAIGRARLLTILIVIVVVCAAAAVGGVIGYVASLSNRLGLDDLEEVEEVLVAAEEGEAYYVLFAADLDDTDGSNDDLDAMLLARIDEANETVSLLAIPGNIEVILSDYNYHPATLASEDGGNEQMNSSMSTLLGVDIAHFVMTDSQGLVAIIDALGGVEMEITQEIDDPEAGWEYFAAGTYTLSGSQALTVLRASNFHEGEEGRSVNRYTFAACLAETILNSGFLTFANIVDVISGNVQTDFTASEILNLAKLFNGLTADEILCGYAPGEQETTSEGVEVFTPSYTSLSEVMELMDAGLTPTIVDTQGIDVDPAEVSVTVWNGSGVSGGAAMLGEILTEAGFDVQEITNAGSYVYTETLIIYNSASTADEAYAVQEALGQGRVIDGTNAYAFTTDILVVLGSEWS